MDKRFTVKIYQALVMLIALAMLAGTSNADTRITYFHHDALGSPVAATDEKGNVLWRETYAPFGQKVVNSNAAQNERVGYTGKLHDNDTGLSYLNARYYDPVVGRFMAIDPVGPLEGGLEHLNRYAYVYNNPYKYIDPTGLLGLCGVCGDSPKGFDLERDIGAPQLEDGAGKRINGVDYRNYLQWMNMAVKSPGNLMMLGGFLGFGLGGYVATVETTVTRGTTTVEQEGLVTVRHHTSPELLGKIKVDKAINPARGTPPGVHVEVEPFGPAETASAETGAFAEGAFVEFQVEKASVQPTYVGPRNTGVIPSDTPYSLEGTNATFNRSSWWGF